jgi:hypothetical protein
VQVKTALQRLQADGPDTPGWVLHLLDKYPTAPRIARAQLVHLQKIPYVAPELMEQVHLSARQSVGSLHGAVAEILIRDLVEQVRPIHGHTTGSGNTFSVHLGKHVFQCFHATCGAQRNVLDLWAR